MKFKTRSLVFSALFLALSVLFPIVFHWFGLAGKYFSPMHIPVLLCGFLCGGFWGLLCGILAPLLSSWLTGMPLFFPMAVGMCFELAVYGFLAGFLIRRVGALWALLFSMLGGRLFYMAAFYLLMKLSGGAFSLAAVATSVFVTTLPGIALQLIFLPALLFVFKKLGLAEYEGMFVWKTSKQPAKPQ